jgi:hypothetical protein
VSPIPGPLRNQTDTEVDPNWTGIGTPVLARAIRHECCGQELTSGEDVSQSIPGFGTAGKSERDVS